MALWARGGFPCFQGAVGNLRCLPQLASRILLGYPALVRPWGGGLVGCLSGNGRQITVNVSRWWVMVISDWLSSDDLG